MKRTIVLAVVVAAAAACSSRERSYSSGQAPSSAKAEETNVVQPSELSPEQVRLVQRALSDRGFAVDPTGSFDARTETALMDFQRARGLPATGNLNSPTVEALGVDPRDVMPVRRGEAPAEGEGHRPSSAPGANETGGPPAPTPAPNDTGTEPPPSSTGY